MILNLLRKKNEPEKEDIVKATAQDFTNTKDIKDKFLYTRKDGYLISYIQIESIDINLLSEREKKAKATTLSAEFSGLDKPLKFLAISRPVDISPLLAEYQQIYSDSAGLKQKELLKHEMQSIVNFALTGEVVERQFFFLLWEKNDNGAELDLNKRSLEIVGMLESAGIKAHILNEKSIVRLCNLVNNPAFVNLEDMNVGPTIPFINY